jgi:hypothetical protein
MRPACRSVPFAAAVACALAAAVTTATAGAQSTPKPPAELARLADRAGNWLGEGTMTEPGDVVTKWTARGTSAWTLGDHWLREDLEITFEGLPTPYVQRSFLGWDRDDGGFIRVAITNAGLAQRQRVELGDDGALTVIAVQRQGGIAYAERVVQTKDGDALVHEVDLLMPRGPSLATAKGRLRKGGDGFAIDFAAPAFLGAQPHEALARLGRCAGAYDVASTVTTAPGSPVKVQGVEAFASAFGGVVLRGTTSGTVEGLPIRYAGEVYWTRDPLAGRLAGHYLGDGGECMVFAAGWTQDGQLLSSFAGPFQGKWMLQRTLMQFAADGAAVGAVSHALFDVEAPAETFRAVYSRKK